MTFLAKVGNGAWKDIGTDDNAPYRVFQDTSDVEPGTQVSYKAIVLDNAGHTRSSTVETATIPPPVITSSPRSRARACAAPSSCARSRRRSTRTTS